VTKGYSSKKKECIKMKNFFLMIIIFIYLLYNQFFPFSVFGLQFTDYNFSDDRPSKYYHRKEELSKVDGKGLVELIEYINNNNFYDNKIKIITRSDLKRMKKEMLGITLSKEGIKKECYDNLDGFLDQYIVIIEDLLGKHNYLENQDRAVKEIVQSIYFLQKEVLYCLE